MLARLVALSLIVASTSAAAQPAPPRQPTGKWVVDFDDAQCLAHRNYGTEQKPLLLVLKAPPLGTVMQLFVMREGSGAPARQVDATVTIDEQPPTGISILEYRGAKAKLRAHHANMPLKDFAAVHRAKTLAIRSPSLDERLALSAIGPLMKVMDRCVESLRKTWNVGDAEGLQSPLKERATTNIARYFDSFDYPSIALDNRQTGQVEFGLLIDEKGKIADCSILGTSGVPVLDAQSCAVLKERARFKPAIGVDGKPARDALIGRVRWVL